MATDFTSVVAGRFSVAHFVPVNEILAREHRAYLDLIPRAGSSTAEGFRKWFFVNARRFDGGNDESSQPAVQTFPGKFGHREKDAFLTAQTLAEDEGFAYWEGYALDASLPVRVAIHHAWNTVGDALVDVTWSKGRQNSNVYLGVPVPHPFLRRVRADLASEEQLYHGPVAFLSWILEQQAS